MFLGTLGAYINGKREKYLEPPGLFLELPKLSSWSRRTSVRKVTKNPMDTQTELQKAQRTSMEAWRDRPHPVRRSLRETAQIQVCRAYRDVPETSWICKHCQKCFCKVLNKICLCFIMSGLLGLNWRQNSQLNLFKSKCEHCPEPSVTQLVKMLATEAIYPSEVGLDAVLICILPIWSTERVCG